MSPVVRSEGLTPSERYLKRLCDRSFLTLWSHPNLYIDKGTGQELCDLLVVFDRHVIIFSDKSCQFPDTGNLKTDWLRWFRRSVAKSAKQVFGAERWIRSHPDRVFVDAQCQQQFPLAFPPVEEIVFHRIVVALGAGDRCRDHFGGSGSLVLSPMVQAGDAGEALPFTVGDVSPDRGYVHVLDDVTLDIVLGELDTVADFTEYLSSKEQLIRSGRLLSAAGEEDLLGYYLRNVKQNIRDFGSSDSAEVIVIDEGFWTISSSTSSTSLRRNSTRSATSGMRSSRLSTRTSQPVPSPPGTITTSECKNGVSGSWLPNPAWRAGSLVRSS